MDEDRPDSPVRCGDGAAGHRDTVGQRTVWVRKSAAAVMTDVGDSVTALLGWAPEDLLGKTSLDFIHPDDQPLAVENWMQMLSSPGPSPTLRFRHRHREGAWRWVEMTNHNFLDDPARNYVDAELLVSEEPTVDDACRRDDGREEGQRPLQLHEALRERERLLHRLAEALPVGVVHVDGKGRILYTNQRLHLILDRARSATLVEQFATVLAADLPRVHEAFEAALHGGLDSDIEVRVAASDAPGHKEIRQCTLSVRTLSTDQEDVVGAVACLTDVTDSVRMREELRLQATFDTLTSCYNRASTMEALDRMLLIDSDVGSPAVIFIDLDDFKAINDHLGHSAGDEMLEVVAQRLHRAVRDNDIVGRIGGDEFLVVCPGIKSSAQALRTASRITRSVRQEVKLHAAEVSCRASVGVAWAQEAGIEADTLIGQADAAMYEAKRAQTGVPVLYGRTA